MSNIFVFSHNVSQDYPMNHSETTTSAPCLNSSDIYISELTQLGLAFVCVALLLIIIDGK